MLFALSITICDGILNLYLQKGNTGQDAQLEKLPSSHRLVELLMFEDLKKQCLSVGHFCFFLLEEVLDVITDWLQKTILNNS